MFHDDHTHCHDCGNELPNHFPACKAVKREKTERHWLKFTRKTSTFWCTCRQWQVKVENIDPEHVVDLHEQHIAELRSKKESGID